MEHVEYVYTEGVDEAETERLLREHGHGVLALAKDNDAYAVPLNYFYDGSSLLIRVSEEPDSTKAAYAESTEMATFIIYDVEDERTSWSVMVRGHIERLPEDDQERFTDPVLNERFPPFHLFDEHVPEVEMVIYELDPYEITARRTLS